MIEAYFILFFICGLAWGWALAKQPKPVVKNFFKLHIPKTESVYKAPPLIKPHKTGIVGEVNKITEQVKNAKVNFKRGKLA